MMAASRSTPYLILPHHYRELLRRPECELSPRAPRRCGTLREAVEPRGVAAGDQRLLVGRDVPAVLGERLARPGPRAVRVRVVGRPHDVAEACVVALPHPHEVANERR